MRALVKVPTLIIGGRVSKVPVKIAQGIHEAVPGWLRSSSAHRFRDIRASYRSREYYGGQLIEPTEHAGSGKTRQGCMGAARDSLLSAEFRVIALDPRGHVRGEIRRGPWPTCGSCSRALVCPTRHAPKALSLARRG